MKDQFIFEEYPKLKFDKNRGRVRNCPCGKNNHDGKFAPYVGFENKGYCHSCGETFLPENPKLENVNSANKTVFQNIKYHRNTAKKPSYIPQETFKFSLNNYKSNNFVKYLISVFGIELSNEILRNYFIGTSNYFNGASIFWQIDLKGNIRTGKIMVYSPNTGKRTNQFGFLHKNINSPNFSLKQCFFGEHLLKDKTKPIAIVESEKTACIASVYLPKFTWLACGGLEGLKKEKCHVLKGRQVSLFPDLSEKAKNGLTAFNKWSNKAKELSYITTFSVSDLLESKASINEREQGLDIADYLLKFDIKSFNMDL